MDLQTQKLLASVISDAQSKKVSPYTTKGEVTSISGDTIYVKMEGSDISTPIKATSVSVKVGDVVDLSVSHNDTHITGNRTDVAASAEVLQQVSSSYEASKIEMENDLEIYGNKIKMIGNTIDMQNNEITMIGNKVDIQSSTIETMNSTIETMNSTIETQGSTIATIDSKIETQDSEIETLNSKVTTLDSTVKTQGSTIETLDSTVETQSSDIKILNSAFVIQNGKLTGISEIITGILDAGYVTTDLLNAEVGWIEDGKIKQGAIGTVEIADSSITTAKIAELSADVIKTGTLKTECLILTTDEVDPETGETKVALITALNAKVNEGEGNILNGAVIADETIEAAKITVVDLNAFGATIGNFNIGTSSMYNGKESLTDPTNGVYIGTDGMALGQGSLLGMADDSPFRVESDGDFHLGGKNSNYINFDPFSGELDIDAKTIKMGSKGIATLEITDEIISAVEDHQGRLTKMEQDAEGFTWTIDETAIITSINEYYKSTSPTSLEGGSWSESQPTWTEGTYIWMRAKNTNGKGVSSYTTPVCITGNTGAQGASGADALSISITSSNGTVFKNNTGSTVLTAHVFKGGVEQTVNADGTVSGIGTVKWYLGSTLVSTSKTLTVNASSVTNTATYTVNLE